MSLELQVQINHAGFNCVIIKKKGSNFNFITVI